MGSNELTILAGLLATAGAAMISAISTAGWRSRVLWGAALVFGVLSLAYWSAAAAHQTLIGIEIVWGFLPLVAVLISLLVVSGREPKKPTPKPAGFGPIPENPGLTPIYLNNLITNSTELEKQRLISNLGKQRARMRGPVAEIKEGYDCINVRIGGLTGRLDAQWYDAASQEFRKNQKTLLEVIKPKDWIEFVGTVAYDSSQGWKLVDCELVAKIDAPPPAPRPRARRRATEG